MAARPQGGGGCCQQGGFGIAGLCFFPHLCMEFLLLGLSRLLLLRLRLLLITHSPCTHSLHHHSLTTHFIIITHSPLFAHSPSSSSLTHHALTHSVITHSSLTDHCSRLPRIIITHSPHLTTVGCGARSLTTHSLIIIITHSPLFALNSPRIIITHSPALRKTLNATKRFWGFDRA